MLIAIPRHWFSPDINFNSFEKSDGSQRILAGQLFEYLSGSIRSDRYTMTEWWDLHRPPLSIWLQAPQTWQEERGERMDRQDRIFDSRVLLVGYIKVYFLQIHFLITSSSHISSYICTSGPVIWQLLQTGRECFRLRMSGAWVNHFSGFEIQNWMSPRVCERGLVVLKVWERFTVLTNEPLLGHAAENGKVKKWWFVEPDKPPDQEY